MLVGEDQPIGTRNRERVQVVHKVLAKIAAGNETTLMPAEPWRSELQAAWHADELPAVSAPSRQRQIGSVGAFAFDMASSQRASSQAVDVDHFVACVIN